MLFFYDFILKQWFEILTYWLLRTKCISIWIYMNFLKILEYIKHIFLKHNLTNNKSKSSFTLKNSIKTLHFINQIYLLNSKMFTIPNSYRNHKFSHWTKIPQLLIQTSSFSSTALPYHDFRLHNPSTHTKTGQDSVRPLFNPASNTRRSDSSHSGGLEKVVWDKWRTRAAAPGIRLPRGEGGQVGGPCPPVLSPP